MITPGQLHSVFPTTRNPGLWCRVFDKVVDEFDLRAPTRLAMWLAQCGYESESFNVLRENMSYQTVAKLRAVYPHEFPTDDSAQKYVTNPYGLACFIYANKDGNGGVETGDGFTYRGGGLIQLTGKANYEGVGKALGLDLLHRPKQITIELVAARTAGFFWKQNDLNAAADAGDFDYTTKRINGSAMEGADARRELWVKLQVAMNALPPEQIAALARRATPVVADGVMTPGFNAGALVGKAAADAAFSAFAAKALTAPVVATDADFGIISPATPA
jgi:putative chitinase